MLLVFNVKDGNQEGKDEKRNVHGRLNASWKICSLAVNGQSFLVIFGYLLNSLISLTNLKESLKKGRN